MKEKITTTDKKELEKLLEEKRMALHNFYFNVSGSKIKNVKTGRNLRKDIARILTSLNKSVKSKVYKV